ncbi:hypothetical protein DE146DRAFT_4051 [Phaeosphaeria sp. MPI-PUGE-AT-0046c]|nr:hypothetical protein DE146DRAFT_4051 [Phaeosphaeria sp. MPI-PUGE-AT-0046c]
MSSWGAHWRCEEEMLHRREGDYGCEIDGYDTVYSLMRTCRKLLAEVCDHIAQNANIVVTDVATLDALLRGSLLRNAKSLEIIQSIPLHFIPAIEIRGTGWSVHELPKDQARDVAMDHAKIWLGLGMKWQGLMSLSRCQLTIDPISAEHWWEINEAALLSPILPLVARREVDLTINLPSHAADDVSLPPFTILRFLRRWYYGEVDSLGRTSVRFARHFPVEVETLDWVVPRDGTSEEDWIAQLMERERQMWRDGFDVAEIVGRDLDDFFGRYLVRLV